MNTARRRGGALEDAVLRVLWAADQPLLPAAIREQLPMELAYTSVATVLVRLVEKGLVTRAQAGNAFVYSAGVDEPTLVAQRMAAVLGQSSDRTSALAGFVSQLGKRDVALLRRYLDQEGQ